MIEAHVGLNEQLWNWLEDKLPEPQGGRAVRMALGPDTMTYDDNVALYFRGQSFGGVLGVLGLRFNRVLFLNEDHISPDWCPWGPEGKRYRVIRAGVAKMNQLHGGIVGLRGNPSRASVTRFRTLLGEHADLFMKAHPRNKLITKYRVRNALVHKGEAAAVSYRATVDGEVMGIKFYPSIEDAILARLSDPSIANVLEL